MNLALLVKSCKARDDIFSIFPSNIYGSAQRPLVEGHRVGGSMGPYHTNRLSAKTMIFGVLLGAKPSPEPPQEMPILALRANGGGTS